MNLTHARLRYLSAIGLTLPSLATGACGKTTTGPDGEVSTVNGKGQSHPELSFPPCPSGKFCASTATSAMGAAGPAPAPFEACASSVFHPVDAAQDAATASRRTSFNADDTKKARTKEPTACCYDWMQPCAGGRAFRDVSGVAVVAGSEERFDWARVIDVDALGIASLSKEARASLAAHWTREAAFEHASVAAFSQLSLDLLFLGAPPELLEATNRAALDEIRHARTTFALASAYAGRPVGPSPLPATPRRHETLEALASATFLDGCVGESLAAATLAEAAQHAQSPALASLLEDMSVDEERHAELAWSVVAWAHRTGGATVARALDAAARALTSNSRQAGAECTTVPQHQGVLDASAYQALCANVLREVIAPCSAALS